MEQALCITKNGKIEYVGQWKGGKRHGTGVWTPLYNDERYEGEFKDGNFQKGLLIKTRGCKYGRWNEGDKYEVEYNKYGTRIYKKVSVRLNQDEYK